jgi:methionyl-tRNA synthetase
MSAGVDLPESVWGHGFVSVAGGKISKSAGAQLELDALVERHGPDAFRYFLLRDAPWDGDRDFSSPEGLLESFDGRYDAELANDLGNLLNRVISMVGKYRDGRVPEGEPTALDRDRQESLAEYHEVMEELLLHRGAEAALSLVRRANAYVDEAEPWSLAREEREEDAAPGRLDSVLGSLIRALAAAAAMFEPFTPDKAAELWGQLGGEAPFPRFGELDDRVAGLEEVQPGEVLFPRADTGSRVGSDEG